MQTLFLAFNLFWCTIHRAFFVVYILYWEEGLKFTSKLVIFLVLCSNCLHCIVQMTHTAMIGTTNSTAINPFEMSPRTQSGNCTIPYHYSRPSFSNKIYFHSLSMSTDPKFVSKMMVHFCFGKQLLVIRITSNRRSGFPPHFRSGHPNPPWQPYPNHPLFNAYIFSRECPWRRR